MSSQSHKEQNLNRRRGRRRSDVFRILKPVLTLETVQTDETGYSKSINNILLLRTRLASLPPGGSRGFCSRKSSAVERFYQDFSPVRNQTRGSDFGLPRRAPPVSVPSRAANGICDSASLSFHFKNRCDVLPPAPPQQKNK